MKKQTYHSNVHKRPQDYAITQYLKVCDDATTEENPMLSRVPIYRALLRKVGVRVVSTTVHKIQWNWDEMKWDGITYEQFDLRRFKNAGNEKTDTMLGGRRRRGGDFGRY